MLIIISPAKTLDFSLSKVAKATKPSMLKDSQDLVEVLKTYSVDELVELMGISKRIAELNCDRFAKWQLPFNKSNAKQAVLAFKGDVYTGLDADSFSDEDLDFAQEKLRIISGLYGVLRPLDLIQPYRLEMGTKLSNSRGSSLYEFWESKLTKNINKQLKLINSKYLVNLASNEYFHSIKKDKLEADIITPIFKDYKNGKYKIISFFAKKARGLMSSYIIKNRIGDIRQLKKFNYDGYSYDAEASTNTEWIFLRKNPL